MKITLVVPTWNEIEGMKAIMPQVPRDLFSQILVIDGGSVDGTIEWAREHGYQVVIQKERGLRAAYREALDHIIGDAMITFSPDGNSDAGRLPALVEKLGEGYDMVIVSRYLSSAKSEDDDIITAFGNWFFTAVVNVLYGAKYTDAMVMYRGYRTALIRELRLDRDDAFRLPERLFHTRVSIEPLLSVRVVKNKLRVTEIPGDEPKRIGGKRKLQIIRWGLTFLWQFIFERFSR